MTSHPTDRTFDDLRKTLSDYTSVLRRRWRIALLVLGAVSSAAFWFSQYLPRLYTATTIFERRDDIVLRNLIRANSPYSFDNLKSSMVMDMTGSRALANAATSIELVPSANFTSEGALTEDERRHLDAALSDYGVSAKVKMLNNSESLDTIELAVEARDPAVAREFVIALRDQYIDRTRDRITDVLSRTKSFFETEVVRYEARLKADVGDDNDWVDFPGVDPDDPISVGTQLRELRGERDAMIARQMQLQAEIEARENFLVNGAESFTATAYNDASERQPTVLEVVDAAGSPVLQRAIESVELQITDAMTAQRMTEEHPIVRALNIKLDALKAAQAEIIAAQQGEVVASKTTGESSRPTVRLSPIWQSQKARVEMELNALRQQLTTVNTDLQKAEQGYNRFAALYQDLVATDGERRQRATQKEEDSMTAAVWRQHLSQLDRVLAAQTEQRGTQFTLIEEPLKQLLPAKPQLTMVLAICLGCGLAAMALAVALAELLDRSFRSVSQVTRSLGVPVLECVGVINTPKEQRRRVRQKMLWTPALAVTMLALLTTASLAYMSLRRPDLHRRAMAKIDSTFGVVGAARPEFRLPSSQ